MSDVGLTVSIQNARQSLKELANILGTVSERWQNVSQSASSTMQTIAKQMQAAGGKSPFSSEMKGWLSIIEQLEPKLNSLSVNQAKLSSANKLGSESVSSLTKQIAKYKKELDDTAKAMAVWTRVDKVAPTFITGRYATLVTELAKYKSALVGVMEVDAQFVEKQQRAGIVAQRFGVMMKEAGASMKTFSPAVYANDFQLLTNALKDGGLSAGQFTAYLKDLTSKANLSQNFNLLATSVKSLDGIFKAGILTEQEYTKALSVLMTQFSTKGITAPKQLAEALKVLDKAFDYGIKIGRQYYQMLTRLTTVNLKSGNSIEAFNMVSKALEQGKITAKEYLVQINRIVPALAKMKVPKVGTKEFKSLSAAVTLALEKVQRLNIETGKNVNVSGLKRLEAEMKKVAATAEQAKGKVKNLAGAFGTLGNKIYILAQFYLIRRMLFAISDMARESIRLGAVMDAAFTNIGAIMKLTRTQIAAVTKEVKAMGQATGYSVEELAKSFTQIARSGLSFGDSIKALRQATMLAKATMGTMDEGVSATLTLLKAFRVEAGQNLPLAIDTITTAINNSRLDLNGFNQAFQYVASIAGSAGIKLKEVTAALGTMADSGLTASKSGVYLRSTMAELLRDSPKLTKFVNNLGLSIKDVGLKYTKSLAVSLENLHSKVSASNASFAAFGVMSKRTAQGMAVLLGNYAKFHELLEMPVKSETMITLQYQMQSFQASWDVAMNLFRDAFLKIFESIKPLLLSFAEMASGIAKVTAAAGGATFKFAALIVELMIVGKVLFGLQKLWKNLAVMRVYSGALTMLSTNFGILGVTAKKTALEVTAATTEMKAAGTLAGVWNPWVVAAAAAVTVGTALYFTFKKDSQSIKEVSENINNLTAQMANYQRAIDIITKAKENKNVILSVKEINELSKALEVSVGNLLEFSTSIDKAYASMLKLAEAKQKVVRAKLDVAEAKRLAASITEAKEAMIEYQAVMGIDTSAAGGSETKVFNTWNMLKNAGKSQLEVIANLVSAYEDLSFQEEVLTNKTVPLTREQELLLIGIRKQKVDLEKLISMRSENLLQTEENIALYKKLAASSGTTAETLKILGKAFGLSFGDNTTEEKMKKVINNLYRTETAVYNVINAIKNNPKIFNTLSDSAKEAFKNITLSMEEAHDAGMEFQKLQEGLAQPIKTAILLREIDNVGNALDGVTGLTVKQNNALQSSFNAIAKSEIEATMNLEGFKEKLGNITDALTDHGKLEEGAQVRHLVINKLIDNRKAKLSIIASVQQQINSLTQKQLTLEQGANNSTLQAIKYRGMLSETTDQDNHQLKETLKTMAARAELSAMDADNEGNVAEAIRQNEIAIKDMLELKKLAVKGSDDEYRANQWLAGLYEKNAIYKKEEAKKLKEQKEVMQELLKATSKSVTEIAKYLKYLSGMGDVDFVKSIDSVLGKVGNLLRGFNDLKNGVVGAAESIVPEQAVKTGDADKFVSDNNKIQESAKQTVKVMKIVKDGVTSFIGESSLDSWKMYEAGVEKIITYVKNEDVAEAVANGVLKGMDAVENKEFKATILPSLSAIQDALNRQNFTLSVIPDMSVSASASAHLSSGGALSGYGGGDTIPAWLESGEFVISKEAVRRYGASVFSMLNKMQIPKINIPKFSQGGAVSSQSMGTLVFDVGGNSYPVNSTPDVLQSLKLELSRVFRRK